jgi:demethylmenaquinone methyltransferase/2-methoxy-6-polyprenyl-1,4-benzoquinol methylase
VNDSRGDREALESAAGGGDNKAAYVRDAFSRIAPRYDLLNHLLSFNIDRVWRRMAIRELAIGRNPRGRYLDLCAGTLDVSAALAAAKGFAGSIVSVDFAEPMLIAGREKTERGRIAPVAGDALHLPLDDTCMTGAIVAFGIRNVADLDAALREVFRVLEPGARFVILEFSTPRSPLVNSVYQLYFRSILPAVGGFVSGHRTAYRYLPKSVANFPIMEELARRMRSAGFVDVRWKSITLGIAAIHLGVKPG